VILGIIDSKPSTAAVMIDGKIVSAISEERLCRMKMANGMPRRAIGLVIEEAGITPDEIEIVAVSQKVLAFEPEPTPWDGWFQDGHSPKARLFANMSSYIAPILGRSPVAWRAHHSAKRFLSRDRLKKLPAVLGDVYGIRAPVRFYDHHFCHAASAYYTSNFDRALVVTLDGGGDGRSGSVYAGEDGNLSPIASVDSFNSLGNLYSYITALCGFKAEKHEGKITGLAALGEPIYANILRQFVRYQEPGQVRYTVPMYHRYALTQISKRLPADFDRAALAASVQLVLEEIGTAFVRYWLRRTGFRNIAVAGGVFSNVKFNQRIHELEEVDNFFVHPAMDDSGLSVGAAFAAFAEQPGFDPSKAIQRLSNVYLGPEYNEREIKQAVEASSLPAHYEPNVHKSIAELLSQGYVVARFTGRMEYGPRALGHRSILYQTTDPSVNDWLNERLKRTEFMPFAPATLLEYAHHCYEKLEGAEDPARFMTITFNCTEEMRSQSPGVVHVDGTARPQIIDLDTAPDFYQILKEYHKLTGIPSLINTSFNMHGEPIVCSPQDAVRSFKEGNLDYLVIGKWVIENLEAIRSHGSGNQQQAYETKMLEESEFKPKAKSDGD
jgi:carbamoyltransferase